MGVGKSKAVTAKARAGAGAASVLTERQQKWFASVKASLERDTGKTLEQWVRLAKRCPETAPKKRADWLRQKYGLGANRAAQILHAAFGSEGPNWDDPEAVLSALWKEPAGRAIYDAVAAMVRKDLPADVIIGPRKTFVSLARKIQFAGILPARGGKAELGLPLLLSESKRLTPMKSRPWAEKHSAILVMNSPQEVDAEVKRLLKLAYAKG